MASPRIKKHVESTDLVCTMHVYFHKGCGDVLHQMLLKKVSFHSTRDKVILRTYNMTFLQGITLVSTGTSDTRIITRMEAGALAIKHLGWIHEACLPACPEESQILR